MTDDTKLMEGEIIAEENLGNTTSGGTEKSKIPTPNLPKGLPNIKPQDIKSKLLAIKKPKFITIILIFIVLIISFIALIVISTRPQEEQTVDPDVFITTPRATPQLSEDAKKVNQDIDNYQKKIDGLNDSIKNYPPPKIDLNVQF